MLFPSYPWPSSLPRPQTLVSHTSLRFLLPSILIWYPNHLSSLLSTILITGSLFTYSMEHSPWEANRFSASQEIPPFYGTRRIITILTSARHLSISWANSIQSIPPHPTSWRSILIVSSHVRLGLPSGLFSSGFPTKTLIRLSYLPYVLHAPPNSFF